MDIHSDSVSIRGSSPHSLPVDCWRRVFDFLSFDDCLSISCVLRALNVDISDLNDALTIVDYDSNVRTASAVEGNSEALTAGYLPCNEDQSTAWFYLQSLRSLATWLRIRQDVLVPERKTNSGQLQTLAVARATIGEERASRLLSAATAIQKLHLGMSYRWGEEVAIENGPAILQGLSAVSSTVTDLSIDLEYYPWDGFGRQRRISSPIPRLGFLGNFPKLKSAEIPAPLLLGWVWQSTHSIDVTKVLPSTLQNLCLRTDDEGRRSSKSYELVITEFVEYNPRRLISHTPNLKRICLRLFGRTGEVQWHKRQWAVRDVCAREGIFFNVVLDNVSIGVWTFDRCPFQQKAP